VTAANIIGAVTAGLSLATGLIGLWNSRRIKSVDHKVNALSDRKDNRVTQLTESLTDAGVTVPASPHITVPGDGHPPKEDT
jgi:hypothetical protein